MKKKKFLKAFVLPLTILALASCGAKEDSNSDKTSESVTSSVTTSDSQSTSSPYTLKITAIGSSTIKVSKTLQLRTSVTGTTQKDVTWSSLTPELASVSAKGLVTALKAGTAKIKATLNVDTNCSAVIEVTIEDASKPESVTIGGYTGEAAWVDETCQLTVAIAPEEAVATVTWATSNAAVATVSDSGLVTFISQGDVSISATSTVDSTIADEVDFKVKYGIFKSNMGSANFDISHQADATNAYVGISDEDDDNSKGYNTLYFAHIKSTKFYAEATFKGTKQTKHAWDWQGIGIGAGLSDNDARFFTFSPHYAGSANNFNKVILRERPETWGALTNRSQTWGENGLDNIDYTEENKIAMIRDGNDYYYLINDKLYYFDVTEKYDAIETIPFLVCYDMPAKFTNYSVTEDETTINAKIAALSTKSFYPAYSNVEYVDDTNFTFKDINGYSKDYKVKSIGDKAKMYKSFEIEFDVDSMVFNSGVSWHTGLTVNLSRYDSADEVETISLGISTKQDNDRAIIGRYTKWNYQSVFSNSQSHAKWYETTQCVKADASAKSHVKIVREIDGEYTYFHLYVDNVEYTFDLTGLGSASGIKVGYTGAYLLWVAGEYATCHVSNFVYKSDITITK